MSFISVVWFSGDLFQRWKSSVKGVIGIQGPRNFRLSFRILTGSLLGIYDTRVFCDDFPEWEKYIFYSMTADRTLWESPVG
jgi:hypothetical protein